MGTGGTVREKDGRPCPPLEDIAAFMDGSLGKKERSEVMAHLGSCEDCYQVFKEAARELGETGVRKTTAIRRVLYFSVPSAIAAGVLIFIMFRVMAPDPSGYRMAASKGMARIVVPEDKETAAIKKSAAFSPADAVRMMAENTDIKTLAKSVNDDPGTLYGFAGAVSVERAAFRIGVKVFDLDVALRAGNRKLAVALLKSIDSHLERMDGAGETLKFYESMMRKIEGGAGLEGLIAENSRLEDFMKSNDALFHMRLGAWAEGGKLASISGDKEFFDPDQMRYFREGLQGRALPKGATDSLEEIEAAVNGGLRDRSDFMQMEKHFRNIIDVM